jgi:hypothetical protein
MSAGLKTKLALATVTAKEPKTLLAGKKWIPASDHADPRKFYERMKQYAEQVRRK